VDSSCSRLAVGFNSVVDPTPFSAYALMSLSELVPQNLWDADKLDELINWLNISVPIAIQRKYLLIEWCKHTGVKFTRALSIRIGVEIYP